MVTTTEDIPGLDESPCTHAPALHTFDSQRPVIVNRTAIRPGDWMRDRGRLRRVQGVEAGSSPLSRCITLVTFTDAAEGSLSVYGDVHVTVWRAPAEGDPAR